MISLTIPTFTKEMKDAAAKALNSEMLVGGESVCSFEDEIAKYIGIDYAVAVNSGSSALLLTLHGGGYWGTKLVGEYIRFEQETDSKRLKLQRS